MSRKTKKLEFIRTKNLFRAGKRHFGFAMKISKTVTVSEDFVKHCINMAKDSLYKKFRIDYRNLNFSIADCDDDFLKNTTTVSVTLSR
jgi:hypothetical protein